LRALVEPARRTAACVDPIILALPTLAEPVEIERGRVDVVKGDTVHIDGERFRIFGCDTPEISAARCQIEREWGERATNQLRALLDVAEVIEISAPAKRDPRGRRTVWLGVNGIKVCNTLIAEASRCVISVAGDASTGALASDSVSRFRREAAGKACVFAPKVSSHLLVNVGQEVIEIFDAN
jgi:endonuclease YncB( thermonuclease family)